LGILAVILLIVFFALFGCAYEFTKCYIEKSNKNEDDEDESNDGYNEEQQQDNQNVLKKEFTKGEKFIIGLLIFLGILCQPLYLMIYMLYALMECYRRFNCWFYYMD